MECEYESEHSESMNVVQLNTSFMDLNDNLLFVGSVWLFGLIGYDEHKIYM